MTVVEIMLLLAGVVFMVGSFFITEKLSPSELNKIAELSEAELKKIIERGISNADVKIQEAIENQLDASSELVDRAMEKETNEKIMAISEFSDTIVENMNKTHNEIMFLYSMLNDKHVELTGMVSDLQHLAADVRNLQETMQMMGEPAQEDKQEPLRAAEAQMPVEENQTEEPDVEPEEHFEQDNHNREILSLHKEGMGEIEIAKQLGLGVGEVRLVIGLYKGERKR